MAITQEDLARELGISRKWVAHALNGNPRVPQRTRDRVMEAARAAGYSRNRLARALVTGKTHLIALWMNVHDSPRYDYMRRQLETIAYEHDFRFELNRRDAYSDGAVDWATIAQWPVEGILAVDSPGRVASFLNSHRERDIPLCSIGGYVAEGADYCRIAVEQGTEQAMVHLFATGARRIAMVSLSSVVQASMADEDALRGDHWRWPYVRMMRERGLTPETVEVDGANIESAHAAVRDYITSHGCPDALYCQGDEWGIAAMRAVREAGLEVPRDVQIVSTEGSPVAGFIMPALSSMRHPIDTNCRRGMELLLARIEEPDRPLHQEELPLQFIPRESTRDAVKKG